MNNTPDFSEITAISVVPPPTSTIIFPDASWIGKLEPIAAPPEEFLESLMEILEEIIQ